MFLLRLICIMGGSNSGSFFLRDLFLRESSIKLLLQCRLEGNSYRDGVPKIRGLCVPLTRAKWATIPCARCHIYKYFLWVFVAFLLRYCLSRKTSGPAPNNTYRTYLRSSPSKPVTLPCCTVRTVYSYCKAARAFA